MKVCVRIVDDLVFFIVIYVQDVSFEDLFYILEGIYSFVCYLV